MSGTIYFAVCRTSGLGYVGQTTQPLAKRKRQHEYAAIERSSDGCAHFYRALRKYGADDFDWRVLAENLPEDSLDEMEAKFIAELGTASSGYNICREGTTTRGIKLSDETRRRMSAAMRPPKSAEHRAKLGAARRGRKLPAEWCRRIGESKRGIKPSPEVVEKRASKVRGRKRKPEHVAAAVASRKARGWKQPPWTEEHRAKMVARFKGKPLSEEHKRKISEAQRKRFKNKRSDPC